MNACPCGSGLEYDNCCHPIIKGDQPAATAEQLMRSRYSAYVMVDIDHLRSSLHPDSRKDFDDKSTRAWAESSKWHGLEIINTEGGGPQDSTGKVEFTATFTDKGAKREHHELASFSKVDDKWYFVSGDAVAPRQVVRTTPKIGRNDPCSCGSGKKYKKCCGA